MLAITFYAELSRPRIGTCWIERARAGLESPRVPYEQWGHPRADGPSTDHPQATQNEP
jgi:hypothetical protein